MAETCYRCGSPVVGDGIGLNKKLINRGIETYLCIQCLAKHFGMTEKELSVMADHFRAAGCTLFSPVKQEE
ncbi:MAG: hypothetical protein J6Q65_07765 [Lentisphaeria bacterium]|nr:hypothetical protein [Lentisphaeria bacterium]